MSNAEVKQPFRIPIEEDYAAAVTIAGEEFDAEGGIWLTYHRQSITLTQKSATLAENFKILSSISRLVEPIKNDKFEPIDHMFTATHAFRAGMWTGNRLKEYVYNGRINFRDTYNVLARNIPYQECEDREEYESNGEYLRALGYAGLEQIGASARDTIDKWSDDLVSEPNQRVIFSLGAGAFLLSAHDIYKNAYPELEENYIVSQLYDMNEIERFLSDDPNSSRT